MKKFLILLSCFFVNVLFSKDYEITPENREAKLWECQEQEKQKSEDKYLYLCEKLLFSRGKCILRVTHQVEKIYQIKNGKPFGRLPLWGDFYITHSGICYSDNQNDSIIILQHYHEKDINYEVPFNEIFCKRLFELLKKSILLKEEQDQFWKIINNKAPGTIVRDGEKLFVFDSPDKEYNFGQE